jgi:hypothetical protein
LFAHRLMIFWTLSLLYFFAKCFVCTHIKILKMLTNFSFWCFECNTDHIFPTELVFHTLSHSNGVFVFSHMYGVQSSCLHINFAYALCVLYFCCANRIVNNVLLYHANIYFAWYLLCEVTNAYLRLSFSKWFQPHSLITHNLWRAHWHLAKVNSFYLRSHAIVFEHWLLFEGSFTFVVSFI